MCSQSSSGQRPTNPAAHKAERASVYIVGLIKFEYIGAERSQSQGQASCTCSLKDYKITQREALSAVKRSAKPLLMRIQPSNLCLRLLFIFWRKRFLCLKNQYFKLRLSFKDQCINYLPRIGIFFTIMTNVLD